MRRMFVAGAIGIGLSLTTVAAPAQAASSTTPQPQAQQCQGLLGCVVPIVTSVTETVTGTVTKGVPNVIKSVTKTVGNVPGTVQTVVGVVTPPTKPVTKPHQPVAKAPTKPITVPVRQVVPITPVAPAVVQPPATTREDTGSPNPFLQALNSVTKAAETVADLFGWNLLALIPMAGIALAISRRMATARRSASGLL
jgi:hypothetical protein